MDISKNRRTKSDTTQCEQCPGYCCYWVPGSILFITALDINRIARHFLLTDGEVRKAFLKKRNTLKVKDDGSCIFLLDGKPNKRCSIHEARPRQCRDFPYDAACPYLERPDLLEIIRPKVEKSLGCKPS